MMGEFLRARLHAIGYALEGWGYVLRTQANAWVHAAITIAVLIVAVWLRLPARDWATLILTIVMVWAAEFLNTAIESLVDLTSPEEHPLAKTAKDVGAAAVLIAALASVLIGLLILGPPLWKKLQAIFG